MPHCSLSKAFVLGIVLAYYNFFFYFKGYAFDVCFVLEVVTPSQCASLTFCRLMLAL
jgi:hypothetical protein